MREDELINSIWYDIVQECRTPIPRTVAVFEGMPLHHGKNAHFEHIRQHLNTELYEMRVRGRGGRNRETSSKPRAAWDAYNKGRDVHMVTSLPLFLAETGSVYITPKRQLYNPHFWSTISMSKEQFEKACHRMYRAGEYSKV